jgi:hypothetical protein
MNVRDVIIIELLKCKLVISREETTLSMGEKINKQFLQSPVN